MVYARDRLIYRPIFGFYRYIDISQNNQFYWPLWVLTKRCYIPHVSRQFAQESTMKQVKTVILQKSYWCFGQIYFWRWLIECSIVRTLTLT